MTLVFQDLNKSGALAEGIFVSTRQGWWIYPTIFGARLCLGDPEPPIQFLDDVFCYSDFTTAYKAVNAWDGTGEPEGWHRHPKTGRRRPEGEQSQEFVRP